MGKNVQVDIFLVLVSWTHGSCNLIGPDCKYVILCWLTFPQQQTLADQTPCVLWFLHMVPCAGLQCVIVVIPDHTYLLLLLCKKLYIPQVKINTIFHRTIINMFLPIILTCFGCLKEPSH